MVVISIVNFHQMSASCHSNAVVADVVRAGELGEDAVMIVNSVDHIWDTTTVAVGDTAVLHCSFDALFQQLSHGNVSLPFHSSTFLCSCSI